jgi:hypothetical protein
MKIEGIFRGGYKHQPSLEIDSLKKVQPYFYKANKCVESARDTNLKKVQPYFYKANKCVESARDTGLREGVARSVATQVSQHKTTPTSRN